MQIIQIARGQLSTRLAAQALCNGELFLDSTNKGKTYELYVGTPDGKKKIGAEGVLSYIETISGSLPANPIEGGIYKVVGDIQTSDEKNAITGVDYPEFKVGDLAIYSSRYTENGGWLRISNGAGGLAVETVFDKENTNYTATDVQQALVEADRNKLAYGGVLFGAEGSTISTAAKTTFALSEVFPSIKAGYYYSIGALGSADKLTIALSDEEGDVLTLEEGDFLSVTSSVTTNDKPLTADDVTLTKIAGGTHDAKKIWVVAGTRNENAGTTWAEEDAAVKSVQDAVNVLYKSKADLGPNGKIPLAELPDTVIGSVEYQGTYDGGTGATFVLPTVENKAYNVAPGSNEKEVSLTKGDYWIYTGSQVNLANLGLTNVTSSEGYINTNDWLIYNGIDADGVAQWSIIDNTSPITGIAAGDTILNQNLTLTGTVTFKGNIRGEGDDATVETTAVASATDGTIQISAPNTALIPAQAAVGTIYKEAGDKKLEATGISELDGKLTLTEKEGLVLTGAENESGAPIGSVNIKQNPNQINDEDKQDITINLPQASGTLARLEDMENSISGTHFYLPRFSKAEGSDVARIVDSPIEIVKHLNDESSNNIKPEGFVYHVNATLTNGVKLADHDVRFRHSTTKVVHMMPAYSGYILNSNSIIDCGEWSASGLTVSNIGKYNAYGNNVDKNDYADSLIESWDGIDAVVDGHTQASGTGSTTESDPTTEDIVSHIES